MQDTNVEGIEVKLGGRTLVVPPLNFKKLKVFQTRLAKFSGGIDPEAIQLVAEVAHAALLRNYPDTQRGYPEVEFDWLEEHLDVRNMDHIMKSVMDVSGLYARALAEANMPQGNSENPLTGPASTPT